MQIYSAKRLCEIIDDYVHAATQRILDMMCQDKIDAKNEKIADLERQLTAANLAASQAAQNAYLLSYIAPRPVPEAPAVI